MKKALILGLISLAISLFSTARTPTTGGMVGTVFVHSTSASTTQVIIMLDIPGTYSATLSSGHCEDGDKVTHILQDVVGATSSTTLTVKYQDEFANSWHVTLLPTDNTGSNGRLCGDSRDSVPDTSYKATTGMPGTDGPITGSSTPIPSMPSTGTTNGTAIAALLALALGIFTLGVLTHGINFARRKP